ncbi:MAG: 4Fe-4S binding protein [Syntrophales bacterium]|nr:4Fe-4S binding protein [Syntrophales bacterium]MDD5234211.1 4Fe-4S binding protein [Syntrophales bacterium]MDD5531772.1 4Fe-4S binding protein [Syntrophales bacterium]HPL64502.1 4Fe-4S binding protein [Syntrophales bacterium]
MNVRIEANADKCAGCMTCALACSFTFHKVFNPRRAYIRISSDEERGCFRISISGECRACKVCAEACPFGAISRIGEDDQ